VPMGCPWGDPEIFAKLLGRFWGSVSYWFPRALEKQYCKDECQALGDLSWFGEGDFHWHPRV
jgi:hypothetical protein